MIGTHPGGTALTGRLLRLAGAEEPERLRMLPAGSSLKQERCSDRNDKRRRDASGPTGNDSGVRALDLGAGSGETVCYLKNLGYDAEGIDLLLKEKGTDPAGGEDACAKDPADSRVQRKRPASKAVKTGDMTALAYPDASYDLCLAECSISVCGNGPAALQEAYRVLRPGGSLLLSDVFFKKEDAPCLSMPKPLIYACWEQEIARAGFVICAFQDETALWRAFFLESLWNDNADSSFCDFFREAGRAGCGYFLAWLKKPETGL